MSIRIGSVPLFQTEQNVFTINSTRSNVLNLDSLDKNVFLNIGNFSFGQSSNIATNEKAELVILDNEEKVATFSKESILLYKPINSLNKIEIGNSLTTSSNIACSSLTTSNITIYNTVYNDTFLNMRSNHVQLLHATNADDGTFYIGGHLGIGTMVHPHYSIATQSNVYFKGHAYAKNIYTNAITFDSNVSGIYFTQSNVLIDADTVLINNLTLLGISKYQDIVVEKTADFQGQLFASNVLLTNKSITANPLKITQRLIDGEFSSTLTGNPISVRSEHPTVGDANIFQLSPYGQITMGISPNITGTDYMVRGLIPENRASYFRGFMYFTNSNADKSAFVVNPDGYLSIGNQQSVSMLEVKNSFDGSEDNYGKPNSIMTLGNKYYTNELPILKCRMPDAKVKLHITSNGTLCFNENPINVYKYEIESSSNSYFNTIEVKNLSGYNNVPINGQRSTLSNLLLLDTTSINCYDATMSNVYIKSFVADSFTTPSLDCIDGINDPSLFKILSDRLLITGCNIVVNNDPYFFSCNENLDLTTDTLRLYTTGKTTDIVNAYHLIGNNQEVKMRAVNTNTLGKISYELETNQNRFKMGAISKNTTPNATDGAVFYITPFISTNDTGGVGSETTAISIFKDKTVKFGSGTYIDPSGILSIGNPIVKPNLYNAYIKGGMTVTTSVNATSLAIDSEKQFVGIATSILGYNLQAHGSVFFSSNAVPQFVISGNVGVGTQFPVKPFHVAIESQFDRYTYFGSNVMIQGRLDTLGNVASTSDNSIKTDLEPIPNALDKIEQLTGYLYTRIDTRNRETGLIAQEVLKVLPEAVTIGNNGLYTLAYGNMAGLFVEAIKELRKENTLLREEVRQLRRS